MHWYGSGFITIFNYTIYSEGSQEQFTITTESGLNLLTESGQELLTEAAP
jgi:hypothetical protein